MKNISHDRIVLQETLSVTSGLFMSIGGITSLLMSDWDQSMSSVQFMRDAMMFSWWQMVMPQTYLPIMWTMTTISLIAGIMVMVVAYKIHKEPQRIAHWGVVVLVASIIGVFCASGFGVGGAILGIITGVSSLRNKVGKCS